MSESSVKDIDPQQQRPCQDTDLEFNDKFASAYDLMENSNKNVFITGKAGTGKSTLLKYFRNNTKKRVVVLAPTGVAALNVRGQTIHSFFKFKPDITTEGVFSIRFRKSQRSIYKNIDAIVIDEISMVRADLLDCIDKFLELYGRCPGVAFGGVQMIFFGDLFQLPPVVTRDDRRVFNTVYKSPYFFAANSFDCLRISTLELEKVYRQKEKKFVQLLNHVRNKTLTDKHIGIFNSRYDPSFEPNEDDLFIYLTTTNALADNINKARLKNIPSDLYDFDGEVTGNFDIKNLPTSELLYLREGAQVMLLNNDPNGRWINGSVGKVISIKPDITLITVELSNGHYVDVEPFTWDMFRFSFDEETNTLESESVGSFTQFPIKLAWAVTIHKSQGKTFEKAIIDFGNGTFSHGQAYVALSRCATLEGIILKRPLRRSDIILDKRVVDFVSSRSE